MKPGIISDASKSAKSIARDAARRMANEPLEVLKRSGEQVLTSSPLEPDEPKVKEADYEDIKVQEEREKIQTQNRYQALQKEAAEIRRQTVFQEVQNKITQGEEVYLADYPELSMEQREVLKAQQEALSYKKSGQDEALVEPQAKKGRRLFGFGQKGQAEKLERRIEKPVPPSG